MFIRPAAGPSEPDRALCDVDCQRIGLLKPAQSLGEPAEYAASLMRVKGSRGLCDSSLDRALGESCAVDARKLLMQALM
ncbi:hypothetical protein BFW01_g4136 [Lasiodiplodia theobromae]|nr:hypothetical protein BFW01_g4136 [Lasiodiplodia theobromae]